MLLGLDLGTTNVKTLVTDWRGKPLARGSGPIQLLHLSEGGVEQDIEEIWRATLAAIKQALRCVDPSQIRAIGVSSQGGAMQILDSRGQPRGRVISWLDQRGRPFDQELTGELGRAWFLEHNYHGGSGLAIGQILRLRQQHPDWLQSADRIGFVGDVILSRLGGASVQDGTSAGLTLLYNPSKGTYDPDLLDRLNLSPGQLPSLSPPLRIAGGILPEVARLTGLPVHTPISPAIHDQYAAALAAGATEPGTAMVGTGTAWVLLHITDQKPALASAEAFVCHHIIEGFWGQILSLVNGGSALTWAWELTGQTASQGDALDPLLAGAPPGSDGVRFWPFLAPFGVAGMAPGTAGQLAGLQLHHRSSHIIRAVVEGLGYELNRHLGLLRANGQRLDRLIIGGGAAASAITPQLLADISGLPLRCLAGADAAVIGAVIVARALLDREPSLSALSREMGPPSHEVIPASDRSLYQRGFEGYLESLPLTRIDRISS